MMHRERDLATIKMVGALCLGLGVFLLLLTFLGTLVVLSRPDFTNIGRGALTVGVAVIMASTLMSLGTQLSRLQLYTANDIDTMRMSWTALFLVMLIGGAASYALLVPPLSLLAIIVIIALVLIRPAVLRLSHRR